MRLFITGSRRWQEFDRYPTALTQIRSWFPCADAPANGAQGGGGLTIDERHGAPDQYCYDPLDPVPYKEGGHDHGEIEGRADVLVYSSPRCDLRFTVVGAVELVLHAASDALDTDFTAKLLDVYPDGRV